MSVHSMIAAMGVTLLLAADARAQLPSCGSVDYTNDIYQNGSLRRVWLQANTFREGAWCPLELQTEAWVWGVGSAVAGRGVFDAPVMLGTHVAYWGKWESQGKHWVIFTSSPPTWVYFAESHDETSVNPPDPLPVSAEECAAREWEDDQNGFECVLTPRNPIIVDAARDDRVCFGVRRGNSSWRRVAAGRDSHRHHMGQHRHLPSGLRPGARRGDYV